MANRYPPTPSFGGVFPSLPYSSIPSQQNGHYLFSGRPPVTSPMTATQPVSAGNPQALNASHYAINAQIPSPAAVMPPIPPHPFSQELFKQLVNSSLPPPPPPSFPPVPIPNLGFSAYQPPPTLQNNFTPPQNHSPDNLVDNSGNPLQRQKGSQPAFEKPSEPILVSREEGELSDGELEEHSGAENSPTVPREEAIKMQISHNKDYSALQTQGLFGASTRSSPKPPLKSSSAGQKATDFARSHASQNYPKYNVDMGHVLQDQRRNIPEITPLSREDSGSSYDPPSVTTPDSALDRYNTRNGVSPQINGKNPSQMRELAKGALLSLAPHGIRYPDLVREGVDPDLLHQLYEEIGIKDSRPELQAGSSTYQAIQTPEQKAFSSVPEPDTNVRSILLPAKPPSGISAIPAAANLNDPSNPQQSVSQSNFDSTRPPGESETPQNPKQAPSISTNSPLATAATNVAMERKDRIAQLLAAKTGKPAPIRNASDPANVPARLISSPDPVPQVHVSITPAEYIAAPNLANQQLPKSIKNKAQTELVRQKMESLKKEAEAKARAQTQSQVSIPPRPDIPLNDPNITQIAPTAEQSQSTKPNQQNVAYHDGSSVTSIIQPVNQPSPQPDYAYRIPGLFMTSDENSHVQERIYTTTKVQARMSSDEEHDLEQESRSSVQDHSSVPGSLTEFNLASLGNKGFISRLPQKRPLASDSFDDPTPPTKRSFGRKDSVEHIEIDVSERESDDGSDGIGMDIDEESQASGLLSSAAPSKEASERDTQNSLPATGQPERPSVQRQTTKSNFGVSTPTKEKDKEDLWRAKNAEIEAMRKRIAEMEQRRKTKQGQSQGQSPQASLPGTPAPPKLQVASPTQASPKSVPVLPTYGNSRNQTHGSVHAVMQTTTDSDHQLLAMSPLSRIAIESPTHNEDLRKKMARRKELQSGLPNLDAEVQATQLKLAQTKARLAVIKREAEKREAEIRDARQREAEIHAEAMRLEEQLNMGLKGRSRFSEELQSLGADLEAVPEVQNTFTESLEPDRTASNSDYAPPLTDLSGQTKPREIPDVTPATGGGSMADANRKSAIVGELIDETENDAGEEGHTVKSDSSNEQFSYDAGKTVPATTSALNGENWNEFDDNSGSQPQMPADLESYQSSIVPRLSDEQSVDEENIADEPSANRDDVAAGLEYDNDGSVSMSDSGTDDYEPAEVPDAMQYSDKESVGYEPDDDLLRGGHVHEVPSDIDDDYEPAEEVEPMEVDLLSIQPVSVNNYQQAEGRQPWPADERPSDPYSPEPVDKFASTDIEDGFEISDANILTKPQDFPLHADVGAENDDVLLSDEAVATHFTAYESPLLFSKNFRFDPSFTALVAGGYNSLTYSNKIDPSRPLCPTEADGGTCTDPKCEEQHFQQMALPDDKILVEMSSARDFKLGDQRDQFVIGLKQVIAELRSKGVREFPTVAGALAAYRRTFAESIDPNRAIPL